MARMVRKQIYIGQENNKLLKQRAKELGITESELIRRGIEQMEYSYNGFSMDKAAWLEELDFIRERARSAGLGQARRWTLEELYEERLPRFSSR